MHPIAVAQLVLDKRGREVRRRVAPIAAKAGPTTVAAANTPAGQLDFWFALNDQPLASNDDAFHAILLYFDGKDDSADYAANSQFPGDCAAVSMVGRRRVGGSHACAGRQHAAGEQRRWHGGAGPAVALHAGCSGRDRAAPSAAGV